MYKYVGVKPGGKVHVSDRELIRKARQGDETACEELVQRYQEAAFRLAYLLLGDPHEAEDAVQEAFIQFFRTLERFDAALPVRPWLLRITTNQAHNRHRAASRHVNALRRLLPNTSVEVTTPHDHAEQAWTEQTLWQAIRQLEIADQEVIYLRYYLALSEEEMAQTLHVAPGTVKSRLHRALARLRALTRRDFPALWEARDQ